MPHRMVWTEKEFYILTMELVLKQPELILIEVQCLLVLSNNNKHKDSVLQELR